MLAGSRVYSRTPRTEIDKVDSGALRLPTPERVTPKSIVIGDWKRLAQAGDFNPAYLHLEARKRRSASRR